MKRKWNRVPISCNTTAVNWFRPTPTGRTRAAGMKMNLYNPQWQLPAFKKNNLYVYWIKQLVQSWKKSLCSNSSKNLRTPAQSRPRDRPLADFLPTLTIKAKDFAAELTHHNVVNKDLYGQPAIQEEHMDNNLAVRKILRERGVQPQDLPPRRRR